jgi:hypothetical protein
MECCWSCEPCGICALSTKFFDAQISHFAIARRLLASNQHIPFLFAYESRADNNLIHLFHYFFSFYLQSAASWLLFSQVAIPLIYLPVTHAISPAGTLEDQCI